MVFLWVARLLSPIKTSGAPEFILFSFGYYIVWLSSIYGFWLPIWYLQTLLTPQNVTEIMSTMASNNQSQLLALHPKIPTATPIYFNGYYFFLTFFLVQMIEVTATGIYSNIALFNWNNIETVVRVTRSLVVCVCFVDRCLSFCPFSFWPLCCLFFFDLPILITPLLSSNSF